MAHKDPAMLGAVSYPKQPLDSYMTERWVTEWLIDALKPSWPSSWASYGTVPGGVVWEPACGTGLMAEVLVERGYDVLATDIHDYGYFRMHGVQDFFAVEAVDPRIVAIVTNPPYSQAERFIRHALTLLKPQFGMGCGKVCMLLRNEYDCAGGRSDLWAPPFAGKYVLTRRPRWFEEKKASPRHNYAWFVWDYAHQAPAVHRVLAA
jgi:hypothetical protein